MELTWLGKQAFSLNSDGVTCLIDPAKKVPFPPKASFSVLTDSDKTLYDDKALAAGYVVDWPGEYEVQGHLIVGVEMPDVADGAVHSMVGITTIDHVTVAFLGTLPRVPESKQLEKLGTVHVLVLPLSSALKVDELTLIVDVVSPGIVIPVCAEGQEEMLAGFLKHYAQGEKEPQASFKMARPEQIPDTPEIVLLTAKNAA